MAGVPSLRIGLIAPAWVPVPPPVYGGTELVVDHLARGLAEAGHDVQLFATGDSTCPVDLHWIHDHALGMVGDIRVELRQVEAAYRDLADVDIIHDHTLLGPLWSVTRGSGVPLVTTIHEVLSPELLELYETVGRHAAVVAISHHQRSTAPSVPVAQVIHHGIDTEAIPLGPGNGGYALFLGRMSHDKGAHRAIEVARAAGVRLLLAAKMWQPDEHRYFTEEVEPLLGNDAVYLGEVGGQAKVDLLAGAEALINPIRWPEPFGLVMIEALSAGTPVLAFPEGSAPEIIDDGRTGFLCADEDDMAQKLVRARQLDRLECRRAVVGRFSISRMVNEHLALYERVLGESPPTAPGEESTTIDLRDAPVRPTGDEGTTHRPRGPSPRGGSPDVIPDTKGPGRERGL